MGRWVFGAIIIIIIIWRGPRQFNRAQTTQWLVVSHVSMEQRVCDEIYKIRMPVLWLDVVSLSESKLLL